MLAYMLLLYLSAQSFVIYANPLYQTYAQPCPCQQNPWYPSDLIFEATNTNPYAIIPQTQSPTYQSSNNQEYINRILSNPSIRTLLDPKTKIYDQDGIEIARNVPGNCPNVINNYIIIPPEALIGQQSYKQDHGERNKNSRKRNRQSDSRSSKNNNVIEKNNQHATELVSNVPNNINRKCDDGVRKSKPEVIVKNDIDNISRNNTEKVIMKDSVTPKDNSNVIRLKVIKKNQKEEAVIQEFKRKFPGIPEDVVKKLLAYVKRKLTKGELVLDKRLPNIKPKVKSQRLAVNKNSTSNHRNRNGQRRSKEPKMGKKEENNEKKCESAIETLIRPSNSVERNAVIEKETINKIIDRKNTEVNSTQREEFIDMPKTLTDNGDNVNTKIIKPIPDEDFELVNVDLIPLNISEVLHENIKDQEQTIEKPNQILTVHEDNSDISVGQADPPHDKKNEDEEKLGTKVISNKEEIKENLDQIYKPDTDGLKLDYNYNVDNTRLPELGSEDAVPITVNGIYEDYYPDFRADNLNAVSNEQYPSPDLNADRYHYAADRAFEMEELSRERRKYEQNYEKNHHSKFSVNEKKILEIDNHDEKLIDKSDESIHASISVKDESEEITFKAPPALEIPDFETKNVREFKSYYEEASKYEPMFKNLDVLDKTSAYSDMKNQKYEKVKPGWKKEKHGDLETVFARSRVVKYGQNSDSTANLSDEGNERYSTVVIAESYPDYEW